MDLPEKDVIEIEKQRRFDVTNASINVSIYDPKSKEVEKLQEEDLQTLQAELAIVMCEVPESAASALSNIYDYFVNSHSSVAKILKEKHIRRLCDWLNDDTVGFLALQCLNFIVNDKKSIGRICADANVFVYMKNIIESHRFEDEVMQISFSFLTSIVKRSWEIRNRAYNEHLYENMQLFAERGREYLPEFYSFIRNSLIPKKYPPLFHQQFTVCILNMLADEEFIECGLQCINLIAENDSNCLEFFKEPLICQALINVLVSENPSNRAVALEYVKNALELDESVRDILIENNVVERVQNSFDMIGDEMKEKLISNVMDFIISFCLNANEEIFPQICDLVNQISFEKLLSEFSFQTKEKVILALRTYSQFATTDMIVETIGPETCEIVASLLDSEDDKNAYNIILFVEQVANKVPPIESFEGFRQEVLGDFHESLKDLTLSQNQDTAARAQHLNEFIESIVNIE